jgi:hypothetical protein
MENEMKTKLQQRMQELKITWFPSLHKNEKLPENFRPWTSNLSPSALYNCSLKCRKNMGLPVPETKWKSIKRWHSVTENSIELPIGVYISSKRSEEFKPLPDPHYEKQTYSLLMLPYGNVWSMFKDGTPFDINNIFNIVEGKTIIEHLMIKDAANPIEGYFSSVYAYLLKNPNQVGIHLKRKKTK